jgi:uncharacterized protein (DUF427 family)
MPRAIWNGVVVAESATVETVEGNSYFPSEALKREYIEDSATHTVCGWKGVASYYTLVVNGARNTDAVWYYPDPKPAAANIKGMVAFWRGVTIEKT